MNKHTVRQQGKEKEKFVGKIVRFIANATERERTKGKGSEKRLGTLSDRREEGQEVMHSDRYPGYHAERRNTQGRKRRTCF